MQQLSGGGTDNTAALAFGGYIKWFKLSKFNRSLWNGTAWTEGNADLGHVARALWTWRSRN